MSDSISVQSSDWSADNQTMPPYDDYEVSPLPKDRQQPWYRWTFSLPFIVLVAIFIYFICMSSLVSGHAKLTYIIGAVTAVVLELIIVGLQWWDRYPYRIEHNADNHKQHLNKSKESDNTDDSQACKTNK